MGGKYLIGVITTRPLPPLPFADVNVDVPGWPPSAMPCWYEASSMLYVDAWPEAAPDEPASVKAMPPEKQPFM